MYIGYTYWSSIHLMKYVLATSVYFCSFLGSGLVSSYCQCILVTTFREVIVWFSLKQRRLVDADVFYVWFLSLISPVWKFMKHGP